MKAAAFSSSRTTQLAHPIEFIDKHPCCRCCCCATGVLLARFVSVSCSSCHQPACTWAAHPSHWMTSGSTTRHRDRRRTHCTKTTAGALAATIAILTLTASSNTRKLLSTWGTGFQNGAGKVAWLWEQVWALLCKHCSNIVVL